jgi:tetratricopeptide (TPR) repeat protein
MLSPISSNEIPSSKTALKAVALVIVLYFSITIAEEISRQHDEREYADLCAKERPFLHVSNTNLPALETIWRNALLSRKGALNRDLFYANACTKLADVLSIGAQRQGTAAPAEVESLYKNAVRIYETLRLDEGLGPAAQNLAEIYEDQKRYREAEAQYRVSLEAFTRKYPRGFFYKHEVLTDLVRVLELQHRDEEAELILKEEIAFVRTTEPKYILDGSLLYELGTLYYKQARYAEALSCFEIAKQHGTPWMPVVWSYIASIHHKLGFSRKAEEEYTAIVKYNRRLIETRWMPSSNNLVNSLNELSQYFIKEDRLSEAVPILKESLKLQMEEFGPLYSPSMSHQVTSIETTARELSTSLCKQGKKQEAAKVLAEANHFLKTKPFCELAVPRVGMTFPLNPIYNK